MADAWLVGAYSTAFGRLRDRSPKDLAAEAAKGALRDAGFDDALRVEATWFGNCGMWVDGQGSIRGQVCLTPLVRAGWFPERTPVINVEAGCATGSLALHGARLAVLAGECDVALALGVEKTFYPDAPTRTAALYEGGIDQYDPEEWREYYRAAGEQAGKPFEPGTDRTIFMDTYAMQACWHMRHFGTTQEQIAIAAAKNHVHGSMNPRAQYRFTMTPQQVLADRPVTYPLTRAMCAPVGDGAAAALVVSDAALASLPESVRERAVRVAAMGLSGGKYRSLDEPGLSQAAARRAYAQAGYGPERVQVAEVHDATSFCEIYQSEMLGFCPPGGGGAFVASGAASLGGRLPINTSGGLVSKGHPVGATGLSMIAELAEQLRGEAGERQVRDAGVALAENGGGVMGFDEAACVVTILEGPRASGATRSR
jgi:acetyl-CoA acetyltransferase